MREYNFEEIERKWQEKWAKEKAFKAIDFHPTKPKYYMLYEFPNVSGNLHMGHLKGTVPSDALARYKRFCGYNVLFPIGGDAFGLPAENAAIKYGINPKKFVADGFKNITDQFVRLGLSFDRERSFCTSDEDYYKWTQWIFMQLYKHGKAYKEYGTVNFCPNCKTVLSNEDSQGGKCDRCNGAVQQVERSVWFLRMKEYSEKLLGNVDRIQMNENLKEQQRNWIGKSEGMQVKFGLVDEKDNKLGEIEIYTTCIETIYGVTFVVVAPENHLIDKYTDVIQNMADIEEYRRKTSLRSEFDRMSDTKTKTGCEVKGLYAINPLTNKKVAVYLADFVLANYGTGAVMAVPSHDQRDYDFAKAFDIPMIQVIEGDVSEKAVEKTEYIPLDSRLINSGEFSGMTISEAKPKMCEKVIDMGVGYRQINYKMKDWPFNRQRFWGEPFPIVYCDKCGTVCLDEKDLPVTLPQTDDYLPNETGDSPLTKITDWVNCTCPKCGGKAKRETDTMPNWAGSSWYWLRYCDPHNDKALADFDKLKYWGSVDCYTGGTEHITRHVLYAFFWQNFLYEIGVAPTRDPFIRKMGSGLILDDQGKKLSKSSANGVPAIDVLNQYGADSTRLHVHFLGGYEDNTPWTFDGMAGITSFVNRVWSLQDMIKGEEVSKEHIYDLSKTIKKVGEDLENLRLNTAISSLMIFLKKVKEDGYITKEELRQFLILLNPIAPHITSEMYEIVFGKDIINETWPTYDEKNLVKSEIELALQVNSKIIARANFSTDLDEKQLEEMALQNEEVIKAIIGKQVVKVVVVKGRLINIIAR